MFIQTGRLGELLATFFTLVWTMLLMDVKDVDTKTVTFFKRAVAQVTGELSITLINTARVLEMLVAIVLVSEYFTTPVTHKAVTICRREQNSETITSMLPVLQFTI